MGTSMSKKPKIIILHGWSYSLDKWSDFIAAMNQVGYICELLPIPGLTDKLDTAWTLDDYVNWLDSKLMDTNNILLGHSNGGRIAIAYTARFPKKVSQLILIASAGIIHQDFKTTSKKMIFKVLAKVGKLITRSENLKKLMYKLAREHDYYLASPVMKQTMQQLISVNVLPLLTKIETPTLLIWGEKDQATRVEDAIKMGNALTHPALHTIPTAKHAPQFTHTEEVVKIIHEYLQSV